MSASAVNNKYCSRHLWGYIVGVRLFGVLLLVVGSLCAQTDRVGLDEGFDKPTAAE